MSTPFPVFHKKRTGSFFGARLVFYTAPSFFAAIQPVFCAAPVIFLPVVPP